MSPSLLLAAATGTAVIIPNHGGRCFQHHRFGYLSAATILSNLVYSFQSLCLRAATAIHPSIRDNRLTAHHQLTFNYGETLHWPAGSHIRHGENEQL